MNATTKQYHNFLGICALLFWSFGATFTSKIKNLPIFEVLAIVFFISFLINFFRTSYLKQWGHLKQPLSLWIIGLLGVYGNDLLYIQAFKYAPASHADLINYVWPLLVILLSGYLPREKIQPRALVGALVCFIGITILLLGEPSWQQHPHLLRGYLYAFLDAAIWAAYVLVSRYYSKHSPHAMGIYCGVGALFSVLLHHQYETYVMPSLQQSFILFIMGLTTQGAAYLLWDSAIKKGDHQLLSVIAYTTPVASILLLIAFNMTSFTLPLLIATMLVSLGALIASPMAVRFFTFSSKLPITLEKKT